MDDDNDPVPLGMKTKVDILNEIEDYVMFNGYSPGGFLLNNNTRIPGPIIAFPKVIFQWNVSAWKLIKLLGFGYLRILCFI